MTGEDEVTVGHDRLKAQHIVLATGATPQRSDVPGAEHVCDSAHFLNLPDLPNRIVFIGGGYISFECIGSRNETQDQGFRTGRIHVDLPDRYV